MNNNFRIPLLEFRKKLTPEQYDIDRVVYEHFQICEKFSEKETLHILEHQLNRYKFHPEVKDLLESFGADIDQDKLSYDLKDLYHVIQRQNTGNIYNFVLEKIVQIIETTDDYDRLIKIVNELNQHTWIPEIKNFMYQFNKSPMEKTNMDNNLGGKANKVYTFFETVEAGKLVFVSDRWFLLNEQGIFPTTLDEHFEGEKLRGMNRIQEAMEIATIDNDKLQFPISEDLTISIGLDKNAGKLFINENVAEGNSTLETLFKTPLIPFMKGGLYEVMVEAANNISKITDLDITIKTTNITNPYLEVFLFNWNGDAFAYKKDTRYGTNFKKYESVLEAVQEIKSECKYDVSYFYPEKLNDSVKHKQDLEDREQIIEIEMNDIKEAIRIAESNEYVLNNSKEMIDIYDDLQKQLIILNDELNSIKEEKVRLFRNEEI